MNILFLLGRLLFGGFFIMSGLNHLRHLSMLAPYASSKGVPSSKLAVIVSGLMILLGGIFIVLGIYITLAVIFIAIFLIVVSFKMHNYWKIAEPNDKMAQKINFNKNMALLGAALMMLMIAEPWIYSAF